MGQNGSIPQNPLFNDWKESIYEQNIYTNIKTNQQIERHTLSIKEQDENLLKKRMQEQHGFINKVIYFQPMTNCLPIKGKKLYYVYTQRMLSIKKDKWIPVTTALSVLKGFRRLSTSFGLMRVINGMIAMNQKDELKVWINKNPAANECSQKALNQQEMLTDIVEIIVKYDKQTTGLLIGCSTLNQAINNILINMVQPKTQSNLSNRTSKPEQLNKKISKGQLSGKNNLFRSTKETEDDFPKPLYQNNYTQKLDQPKKQVNIQPRSQYLLNVHLPTSPRYLKMSQDNYEDKNFFAFKSTSSIVQDTNAKNLTSQKHNQQKQSTFKLNSSQPQKIDSANVKRAYRPIQHKIIQNKPGIVSNIVGMNRKINSPQHESNSKALFANKNFHLKKYEQSENFYDRKSDINRDLIYERDERDEGRASDFTAIHQTKKTRLNFSENQNQESSSGQLKFYYPGGIKQDQFGRNIIPKSKNVQPKNDGQINFNADIHRTKTQEFSNINLKISEDNSWNSLGSSPQYQKTSAYLKSQHLNRQKYPESSFQKNKIKNQNEKALEKVDLVDSTRFKVISDKHNWNQRPSKQQSHIPGKLQKIRSYPNVGCDDYKTDEAEISCEIDNKNNYEQRKVMKQQFSKKIRDQFSNILAPKSEHSGSGPYTKNYTQNNVLAKQKSSKDIIIKKKIETKKAQFADLKTQAMKVLLGD